MKVLVRFNDELFLVPSTEDKCFDREFLLSEHNKDRWPDEAYTMNEMMQFATTVAYFTDDSELLEQP